MKSETNDIYEMLDTLALPAAVNNGHSEHTARPN